MTIDGVSTNPDAPYANFAPIVDRLVELGNLAVDGGFILSQGGWYCRLERSIDVNAVEDTFELPPSIKISADTVLDERSWCAIVGPGGVPPQP